MDNDSKCSPAVQAADDNVERFHESFDIEARNIIERVRDDLLEGPFSCTREEIVAQIIMNEMFPHPCDPELRGDCPSERMTTKQKVSLLRMAQHMGPDWTQALYHAAVFITKVA